MQLLVESGFISLRLRFGNVLPRKKIKTLEIYLKNVMISKDLLVFQLSYNDLLQNKAQISQILAILLRRLSVSHGGL